MQRRFLAPMLVLVVLLTLLALAGYRAIASVPALSFAAQENSDGTEDKKVFLTFDDGPSTRVTERVLDILKQEGVKATFFIVSDRVWGREETLRRTVREGHSLGVHSATHEYQKIYATDEAFLRDVKTCEEVIERVAKVKPRVYRFPGGGGSKAARERRTALLRERGYRVVQWNAVCGDEEIAGASAETLLLETKKTSAGKRTVVLLMHDSVTHAATAEALPAIIAYYRAEGYRFCTF